jgi:hypothetical protein
VNAGRELDALVAEKVMGRDMTRPAGFKHPIGMPHYSTDIAAAWEVVERLRAAGHWFDLRDIRGNGYWASFGQEMSAEGKTASLAICLAALKALDV